MRSQIQNAVSLWLQSASMVTLHFKVGYSMHVSALNTALGVRESKPRSSRWDIASDSRQKTEACIEESVSAETLKYCKNLSKYPDPTVDRILLYCLGLENMLGIETSIECKAYYENLCFPRSRSNI